MRVLKAAGLPELPGVGEGLAPPESLRVVTGQLWAGRARPLPRRNKRGKNPEKDCENPQEAMQTTLHGLSALR